MPLIPVEVCIDQPDHIRFLSAETCQRVEMCSNLKADGLTPLPEAVEEIRLLGFEVVAMVRPRPGDFCYSKDEFESMKQSTSDLVTAGAHGIVLGLLDRSQRVPVSELRELVESCSGLPVTFHRAFDRSANMQEDLERIIEAGCQRLLTSGGASTAWLGRKALAQLVKQADSKLEIIAGGGVRPGHAAELISETSVPWIHLSARHGGVEPDPLILAQLQNELASIDR